MVRTLISIFCLLSILAVVGCSNEGPAEKGGKKIDKTKETIEDSAKKAVE